MAAVTKTAKQDPNKVYLKTLFTIPCENYKPEPEEVLKKIRFNVFVGAPRQKHNPLFFQREFIRTYWRYEIPNDVSSSLAKLNQIACENKVGFQELCLYALNYPNAKPSKLKELPQEIEVGNSRLAEELYILAKLVIKKDDLANSSLRMFFIGYLMSLIFENGNNMLSEAYKRLFKHSEYKYPTYALIWNTAVTLDSYGQFVSNPILFSCMETVTNADYYLAISYVKALKTKLKSFSRKKINFVEFRLLDIKSMQNHLLKIVLDKEKQST